MDFLGDIVEKEVEAPSNDPIIPLESQELKIPKKPSKWRQRLEKKKIATSHSNPYAEELEREKKDSEELTEREKIHLENLKQLAAMSPEEIAKERAELIGSIDPKILNALMRKQKKGDEFLKESEKKKDGETASGSSKPKKKVSFKEPEEGESTEQGESTDQNESNKQKDSLELGEDPESDSGPHPDLFSHIHFPKTPQTQTDDYKIDLNDPEFVEKLHQKYFPDLPRETEKLKWMEPAPPVEQDIVLSPDELRFDFKGNIIPPEKSIADKIPVTLGLYHHGDDPLLPGYTLKELAHLMRLLLSSQRCIAIRTVGRVLHKLSLHKFDIFVEEDLETTKDNEELKIEFEHKLWKQVLDLKIIPVLTASADENITSNLSVRTYAVEALWLFRDVGGDKLLQAVEKELANHKQ